MNGKFLSVLCIAVLSLGAAQAQTPAAPADIKMDLRAVKLEAQNTPQIQAGNVVDKRWKPKTWLEIDSEFEIKLPRSEGGNAGTYPSLEFRYYFVMNAQSPERKRYMLSGTVNYANIPAHDKCHALAYVTPATLKRVLLNDKGSKNDVMGWAIEVYANGVQVAEKSEGPGAKWWKDTAPFTVVDGAVVGKDKTPFSVLWGDYDVAPSSK